MKINIFYVFSLVFAILSSLSLGFLPEIQTLMIISAVIFAGRDKKKIMMLLITVFATHHYVVPDAVLRFHSEEYPSIYTKSYYGVKLLDIITVIIFVGWFKYIKNVKLILRREFPVLIAIPAVIGVLFLTTETTAVDIVLFLIRSYLLIYVFFVGTINFSKKDFIFISKLSIFSWSCLMLFSILIPQQNPMYRELFGIQGIIYFAGDEYLTIGMFLSIIYLLRSHRSTLRECFSYFLGINIIFLMCLIAQRKGAIPYFLILNTLSFLHFFVKRKLIHAVLNVGIIVNTIAMFLFVFVIYSYLPETLKTGFVDYHELTKASINSLINIFHNNIVSSIVGITPFGKYELVGLDAIYDNAMSFGDEVGEKYRYQLWGLPGDRLILNCGLLGYVIYYCRLLIKSVKVRSNEFYLYFSVMPAFTFALITPVNAIAIGIGLSVLSKQYNRDLVDAEDSETINTNQE